MRTHPDGGRGFFARFIAFLKKDVPNLGGIDHQEYVKGYAPAGNPLSPHHHEPGGCPFGDDGHDTFQIRPVKRLEAHDGSANAVVENLEGIHIVPEILSHDADRGTHSAAHSGIPAAVRVLSLEAVDDRRVP